MAAARAPRRTEIPTHLPRRFADGGAIRETTEALTSRIAAKYGLPVPAVTQPAPAHPVQKQAQPAPQQQAPAGVAGTLRGRAGQIDQAVNRALGYADGGKIKGPGTPKSDSIPAKVKETGEHIRVSTGERILSSEQDAFLGQVAKSAGYDSLDAMLEDGTGQPVGPTIKAGQRAAASGMAPEDDSIKRQFGPPPPTLGSGLYGASWGVAAPEVLGPKASQATPVPGAPGITREVSPQGGVTYTGTGNPAASAGRSAMDIYRNEAVVKGLDPNTFSAQSAPKAAAIGDSSRMSDKGWSSIEMPAGLSARQQANFMTAQDQNQTARRGQDIAARGQDLNHGVALSGQDITARGQDLAAQTEAAKLAGNPLDNRLKRERIAQQALRTDLETRIANEIDENVRDGLVAQLQALDGRRVSTDRRATLGQERQNFEIDAARERVAGLSPDDIKRKTQQFSATGRENPDFDPGLAKAVGLAGRRKIGDDPIFDARQQDGQPPVAGDLPKRFQADTAMKGHSLGRQTDQGTEVFDSNGRLIGHYR
ncbi:MAG: hypothetical protein RBS40_08155 [Rhodocyclaceae bacterium]|jgi:hypothetical protein|nr:hypothetical protein [Rhodocyclaceae bacterium]